MSEVENEQAKGSMMSVSAKEDVELEDRIQSFSGAEEKWVNPRNCNAVLQGNEYRSRGGNPILEIFVFHFIYCYS